MTRGNPGRDLRFLLFFSGGALVGYLIFHPYAMLVYFFTDVSYGSRHWQDLFIIVFQHMTLSMALPFVFFGGLTGLLAEVILDRQKRLLAAEAEAAKKKVALETLQRLMVTLSHHLLNANAVIGGMAQRCAKKDMDQKNREEYLNIIGKEARKIDAVMQALKKITEIRTADYSSGGHDLMIDIAREIEDILEERKKMR